MRRGRRMFTGTRSRHPVWVLAGGLAFVGLLGACAGEGADGSAEEENASAAEGSTDEDESGEDSAELTRVVELSAEEGPDFIGTPGYIAREMGYYEEEGLEVVTEYPGSTPRTVQLVLGGEGDIAQPDPAAAIAAVSQENDLTSVWTSGRGTFFGFAVPAGSEITEWSAEQLQGTEIGISEFAGGEVPLVKGGLSMIGLEEGRDVTLVPVGGGGPEAANAVESGSVDIITGSFPDFSSLQAEGVELDMITPETIENFPRNSVVVRPDYLEENRDVVEGYLRAWSKATVFMRANPRAAAEIAQEAAPENLGEMAVEDIESAFISDLLLQGVEPFFEEGSEDYQLVGRQRAEDWENYMNFLIEGGVESDGGVGLSEPVDVGRIVDNGLIEAANDFDYAEIEQQASDY